MAQVIGPPLPGNARVMFEPEGLEFPVEADLLKRFDQARITGRGGGIRIECIVQASGRLAGCKTSGGIGTDIADAGLQLAALATVDRRRLPAGSIVKFWLRFNIRAYADIDCARTEANLAVDCRVVRTHPAPFDDGRCEAWDPGFYLSEAEGYPLAANARPTEPGRWVQRFEQSLPIAVRICDP
jgi:hypothetical protein